MARGLVGAALARALAPPAARRRSARLMAVERSRLAWHEEALQAHVSDCRRSSAAAFLSVCGILARGGSAGARERLPLEQRRGLLVCVWQAHSSWSGVARSKHQPPRPPPQVEFSAMESRATCTVKLNGLGQSRIKEYAVRCLRCVRDSATALFALDSGTVCRVTCEITSPCVQCGLVAGRGAARATARSARPEVRGAGTRW